jgi:HECT-domain (ubiquitin-transferase)
MTSVNFDSKKMTLVSATNPCILDSRTGKPFSADLKLEAGRHTFRDYRDKEEFLEAFTAQRSAGAGRQLRAFMDGFWGLLEQKGIFFAYSQSELEKAIGGVSEIDLYVSIIDLIRFPCLTTFYCFSGLCSNNTDQELDEDLEWFHKIVHSWSIERQRALLHYVTGLKRVPATDQFKVMKAPDGHIRRLSVLGNKERAVPDNDADTPEHVLFIPAFEEYQTMEEDLISVMYNCDVWVRFLAILHLWNRS